MPPASLDLLEDRLQALLELAAVLGAGEQRADVERDDAAVAQRLGHVAGDDALGEALDDGGLADAGLADEDGVVLRAAAEHLDDAADLVVAPDDRVELALLGLLGEVAAVLLERHVLVLGALVGDAVRAADLGDRLQQGVLRRAVGAQRVARLRADDSASASRMCSVETYSSLSSRISPSASRSTRTSSLDGPADSPPWLTVGSASSAAFASERTAARFAPSLASTGATTPPSCSSRTTSRCSGVTCGLRRRSASEPAAAIASWDLMVNRSGCIRNLSRGDADYSAAIPADTSAPARDERLERSSEQRRRGQPAGGPRRAVAVALHRNAMPPGRRRGVPHAHEVGGRRVRDELGPERPADALDLRLHLLAHLAAAPLERLEPPGGAVELLLQHEHALDAGEVEPELVRHLLDAAQALDVRLRVQARALRRALGLDEPAGLVHPQRLRVHVGELGGDRDHEDPAVAVDRHAGRGGAPTRHHDPPRACANSFARGLPFITCDSFSTASDCSVLRLAGTSMTKR